jgi:hypothetical protein
MQVGPRSNELVRVHVILQTLGCLSRHDTLGQHTAIEEEIQIPSNFDVLISLIFHFKYKHLHIYIYLLNCLYLLFGLFFYM